MSSSESISPRYLILTNEERCYKKNELDIIDKIENWKDVIVSYGKAYFYNKQFLFNNKLMVLIGNIQKLREEKKVDLTCLCGSILNNQDMASAKLLFKHFELPLEIFNSDNHALCD